VTDRMSPASPNGGEEAGDYATMFESVVTGSRSLNSLSDHEPVWAFRRGRDR
jgi:hypothetical protein